MEPAHAASARGPLWGWQEGLSAETGSWSMREEAWVLHVLKCQSGYQLIRPPGPGRLDSSTRLVWYHRGSKISSTGLLERLQRWQRPMLPRPPAQMPVGCAWMQPPNKTPSTHHLGAPLPKSKCQAARSSGVLFRCAAGASGSS